jgi:hypothetical protein
MGVNVSSATKALAKVRDPLWHLAGFRPKRKKQITAATYPSSEE